MKKLMVVPLVAAVLSACSSAPKETFDNRAYSIQQQQNQAAERAVEQAPKWMTDLPKSNSAVYENGTAVSTDMAMSVNKARTLAFGKICMAAGGRTDQQSKTFKSDNDNVNTETSDLAIRTLCPSVDITGVQVVETKMIAENGRFRTYVLVALPIGVANPLKQQRDQAELNRSARQRSDQAFREMDQRVERTPQ